MEVVVTRIKTGICGAAMAALLVPFISVSVNAQGTTGIHLPLYAPVQPSISEMRNPLPAPPTAQVRAETKRGTGTPGTPGQEYVPGNERAFGSFGIPYTSVRVQDSSPAESAVNANRLSTTYPYRAIGRLDFSVGSGSAYCSASLIMRSVIVTAAHCVADFGSNSWYSNWTFRPAYYGPSGSTSSQKEPFGAWTVDSVSIARAWFDGSDTGSGSARNNDVAVLIVRKNNSNKFIGDVVGWMSYGWDNYSFKQSAKTGNLLTAATSTLGYPGLLDSGRIMQRADGPTYTTTVSGAKQLWQGNDFTGGSSGGPWIVNFGFTGPSRSGGAVVGSASAGNRVIGVTSWGSADPNAPKDNYSSQFARNTQFPSASYATGSKNYGAGNIGSLLKDLCDGKPSGSTQSYSALGYCNF